MQWSKLTYMHLWNQVEKAAGRARQAKPQTRHNKSLMNQNRIGKELILKMVEKKKNAKTQAHKQTLAKEEEGNNGLSDLKCEKRDYVLWVIVVDRLFPNRSMQQRAGSATAECMFACAKIEKGWFASYHTRPKLTKVNWVWLFFLSRSFFQFVFSFLLESKHGAWITLNNVEL